MTEITFPTKIALIDSSKTTVATNSDVVKIRFCLKLISENRQFFVAGKIAEFKRECRRVFSLA